MIEILVSSDLDWMSRGACANLSGKQMDVFFPDERWEIERKAWAKHCNACPVRRRCEKYGAANPELEGVWGGEYRSSRFRTKLEGVERRKNVSQEALRSQYNPGDKCTIRIGSVCKNGGHLLETWDDIVLRMEYSRAHPNGKVTGKCARCVSKNNSASRRRHKERKRREQMLGF